MDKIYIFRVWLAIMVDGCQSCCEGAREIEKIYFRDQIRYTSKKNINRGQPFVDLYCYPQFHLCQDIFVSSHLLRTSVHDYHDYASVKREQTFKNQCNKELSPPTLRVQKASRARTTKKKSQIKRYFPSKPPLICLFNTPSPK